MSKKEFHGYPSPYPNGYSEFADECNDVFPDEVSAYNRIIVCDAIMIDEEILDVALTELEFHASLILEMVNLSVRSFDNRIKKFKEWSDLSCDNIELMNIYKHRISDHIRKMHGSKKLRNKITK